MESPVVVDKPPEYHGNNERGFPFDEEEGSGAWSELAARHPDIAARLRQRPATWARKRRPSSQDATEDFGDNFGSFDRFPFDDIPTEFREHFPSHWNRRFSPRDEPAAQPQASPPPQPPQHQTTSTQTEQDPSEEDQQTPLPQYGLRNTVDLGQRSPADPSLVDADERSQRSVSAPPDNRKENQSSNNMSGHNQQEQHPSQHNESSNVRHIPIFVEGRDEPVINKSANHNAHYSETKPTYVPPPPQPHIDREQYFADDGPVGFHHAPNFSRAFGTPFNKGFRQGPQPFVQQKVYPQTAFARGASPQRSQSPKPQMHPEEHYGKVHHDQSVPKTEQPSRPQQKQPQQQQPPPRKQTPPQQQQAPPREQTPPPPKQQTPINDPITQILTIQTDVLNLMTDVENFTGTKKDKRYIFLDEMLTRNLIKLDNIETDGKENVRQARKDAIKCIQKCIAVLEAKAENKGQSAQQPQSQDEGLIENTDVGQQETQPVTENGEHELKEASEEEKVQPQVQQEQQPLAQSQEQITEIAAAETSPPQGSETRPEETNDHEKLAEIKAEEQNNEENVDKKISPKKGTNVKKRDKSKDKKDAPKDSNKEENVEQNEKVDIEKEKVESMQVDDKGDKAEAQGMEVDGAASH